MITLTQVHKAFGSNRVLQGVNLTIERGQSMVIIGGSGTGKSVLLKSILGLIRPDQGTITLDGVDVTKTERDPFLARFGMLFQGGALFDSMRVWENVAFRLMRGHAPLPPDQARTIALEKLRRVGLTAGASAPDILVQEVIARLRELGVVSLRKMTGVEEKVRFPLPLGLGDRSMAEAAASRS